MSLVLNNRALVVTLILDNETKSLCVTYMYSLIVFYLMRSLVPFAPEAFLQSPRHDLTSDPLVVALPLDVGI